MCPSGAHDELNGRVNTRAHQWVEDWIAGKSDASTWANESQVARDMLELGLLVSDLNSIDKGERGDGSVPADDPYFDPPVFEWERPQGEYPADDKLVCPECANSSTRLFRYRNLHDIEAIECLYCGHMGEADTFLKELPDHYYWARPVRRGSWCLMNDDTRRSLCDRHSEPVEAGFAPDIEDRPSNICRACWRNLLGKDYDPRNPDA